MMPRRDVDGGWAWFVLGASYFNILLCSGLAFIAGVYQVVFLEHFHGSVALMSWVTSLFSSLMQLGGPLSSMLANKFSCRVSVLLGGCFITFGLFLSGLAEDLGLLFVSFGVLAGIGLGLTYTASTVVISFFFDRRRTLVNGLASSAGGLGIFLAPQVSQILFDNFTWRESLFILAAISAHVCVAGALMFSIHENKTRCGDSNCQLCGSAFRKRLRGREHLCNVEQHCMLVKDGMKTHENIEDNDVFMSENQIHETVASSEFMVKHAPDIENREDQSSDIDSAENQTSDNDSSKKRTSDILEREAFSYYDKTDAREGAYFDKQMSYLSKSYEHLKRFPAFESHKRQTNSASYQELSPIEDTKASDLASKYNSDKTIVHSEHDKQLSQSLLDHPTDGLQMTVKSKNPPTASTISSINHLDTIAVKSHQDNTLCDPEKMNQDNTLANQNFVDTQIPKAESIEGNENPLPKHPRLFRNHCFWVLCLSLFISNAGCGIFNIHVPSFLKSQGLSEQEMTNVLSMNGIAILCGRCLIGALANSVPGNDLLFFMTMHVIGGIIMCFMSVLGTSYLPNMLIIFGIGSYAGTVYAVLPTLTIHYVGLDGLATAFGIEMVCAGLGYLVSPPLAGIVVDLTDTYSYNIACGGFLFILGGLVLMVLPSMEKSGTH